MIIDKKLSKILESEEPSIQELRNIAKNMGIRLKRSMRKKDIIKVIKNKLLQLKEEGLITDTSNQMQYNISQISKINLIPNDKILKKNLLTIVSVNSNWIYAFWNFSKDVITKIEKIPENTKIIMRLYDITNNDLIEDANRIYESINDLREYKSYYFYVPLSSSEYIGEIGYLDYEKNFIPLIRSNKLKMPSDRINNSDNLIMYNVKTNKRKKMRERINVNIVEKIPSIANGNMALPQLGGRPPISGGGSFVWNLYSLNKGIKK